MYLAQQVLDPSTIAVTVPSNLISTMGTADVQVINNLLCPNVIGVGLPPPQCDIRSNVVPFTITQPLCSFSLGTSGARVSDVGGTYSLTVSAPAGCSWTAVSANSWFRVVSGIQTASGNGTVSFVINANSGAARSGFAFVAGKTFTLSQDAGVCGAIDISSEMTVQGSFPNLVPFTQYFYSGYFNVINRSGQLLRNLYLFVHLGSGYSVYGDQLVTTCLSPGGDYLIPVGALQANGQYSSLALPIIIATSFPEVPFYSTRVLEGLPGGILGQPTQPTSTGVSPSSASLTVGQQQQFTTNTNNPLTWSIDPLIGWISSAGLYTAPSFIADNQSITITATDSRNPTAPGTAQVTLNPPVVPATVTLSANTQQQFTSLISGGVSWTITPNVGSMSASGMYSAPSSIAADQTVLVTATSVVDNSQYTAVITLSSATVVPSVSGPSTTINGLIPFSVTSGGSDFILTITGTEFDSTSVVLFGNSAVSTSFINSTQLTATIPASLIAIPGTMTVSVDGSNGNVSNSLAVSVVPGP